MSLRALLVRWLAPVFVLGAAVHLAFVHFLPNILMAAAEARVAKGGGGVNHMIFPALPDETARAVVRPSPDLLYSICVFDLSQHDVHIRAGVPKRGYWSLALYGGTTDTFFVTDNKSAAAAIGAPDLGYIVDAVLTRRRATDMTGASATIHAPSNRGILLIRRLIDSSTDVASEDRARRTAVCEAVR